MSYIKPEPFSARNYIILNEWWENGDFFMEIRQNPPEHKICDDCGVNEDVESN